MNATLPIPQLHHEYTIWIQELNFYKEELSLYVHNLALLLRNTYDRSITTQAEQYQNQFIRQKEVIDELKHRLGISERQLKAFVLQVQGMGLSSIKMDNHPNLRTDMQTFRKLYTDLKKAYRKFEVSCA